MPKGRDGSGIEQLYYTWAPRGAEGINRFQIAAISAGLKRPPLVSLMPDLRRFCRYDRPAGASEGPASFGWLDLRQHRVAFLRVPVPGTGGRSGSFAAHLLVGPIAALPAGEIASSFGAGFWWTGLTPAEHEEIANGKRDFGLPQLDWEEALRTRVASDADGVDTSGILLTDLLSRLDNERLVVHDDGTQFGPALRTVGRRCPDLLAGISLSTFEAAAVFPFTVVGSVQRRAGARVCELAKGKLDPACGAVSRALLSEGSTADLLWAAIGLPGNPSGRPRTESRLDFAGTLVGLAEGSIEGSAPAAILASPAAVAYLAQSERGRRCLVTVEAGRLPQLLAALTQMRVRIPPAQLDELCRAFGRRIATSGELHACAAMLAAFPDGAARVELEEEMLRRALRIDSKERKPEASDALALVQIAAARRLELDRCLPLLRAAAPHIGVCSEDRLVPKWMLAAMLSPDLADDGTGEELCRALRKYPSLLVESRPSAEEERLWLNLGLRLPSHRLEEALPALLAGLARQSPRDLSALLDRVPDITGRRALVAAGHLRDRGATPRSLGELCEQKAETALAKEDPESARRLLALADSNDAQIATELLAIPRRTTSDSIRVGGSVGSIESPGLRKAIFEAALAAAVRALRHPDDAGRAWKLLCSSYPKATTESNLEHLLRIAMRAPPASGQGMLLVWVCAGFLPAHDDLRQRNGEPKNNSISDLSSILAGRMSSLEVEFLQPLVDATDRPSRRWWKSLVSDYRKAYDSRRARWNDPYR
jgi:hypothetical protein